MARNFHSVAGSTTVLGLHRWKPPKKLLSLGSDGTLEHGPTALDQPLESICSGVAARSRDLQTLPQSEGTGCHRVEGIRAEGRLSSPSCVGTLQATSFEMRPPSGATTSWFLGKHPPVRNNGAALGKSLGGLPEDRALVQAAGELRPDAARRLPSAAVPWRPSSQPLLYPVPTVSFILGRSSSGVVAEEEEEERQSAVLLCALKRTLAEGETILKQGDPGDTFYLVEAPFPEQSL